MFFDEIDLARGYPSLFYPDWLAHWWMEFAKRRLGVSEEELEDRLHQNVSELSNIFTTHRRRHFAHYEEDRASLIAYGLFYFPQTFIRTRLILLELLERGWTPPKDRPLRILDLGAGLGAASLSIAHLFSLFGHEQAIEITAIDHSQESLSLMGRLKEIHGEHWEQVKLSSHVSNLRDEEIWKHSPAEGWDLVVASFALNEAFFQIPNDEILLWSKGVIDHLAPQGVFLIIEPAASQSGLALDGLRDTLLEENSAFIVSPCPHQERCPLRQQGKYICHDVRSWLPPDAILSLNQRLFRKINFLKFSFLALARKDYPSKEQDTHHFRIVSPIYEERGKFAMMGCFQDGQLHKVEFLKRHLAKAEQKTLRGLDRGSYLSLDTFEVMGKNGQIYRALFSSLTTPSTHKSV